LVNATEKQGLLARMTNGTMVLDRSTLPRILKTKSLRSLRLSQSEYKALTRDHRLVMDEEELELEVPILSERRRQLD
jgi:hypothetical protein